MFARLGLVLLHVGGAMLPQVRTGGVLGRMVTFLGGESPIRERDAR